MLTFCFCIMSFDENCKLKGVCMFRIINLLFLYRN